MFTAARGVWSVIKFVIGVGVLVVVAHILHDHHPGFPALGFLDICFIALVVAAIANIIRKLTQRRAERRARTAHAPWDSSRPWG